MNGDSTLAYQLRRRRAIRAAAIQSVGWSSGALHAARPPEEHWLMRGGDASPQNRAAVEIVTRYIEAYEAVMAEG